MAQDIKTAFFDIDGTLTSFVTHVVPQSTVDALHALQRNGVKVFICSGRARRSRLPASDRPGRREADHRLA